jgi:LacI family transcriptional regulator
LIDRRFDDAHFVGGDDERIGFIATDHLFRQGYRRIAHLRGPNVATAIGRLKGYLKALRAHGLRVRRDYIIEASYHEETGGFKAMKKLLEVSPRPDSVFAASDPIAIGALEATLRANLRVPEDLGLVGVGNHRYGNYLRVPLSTVDQNRLKIGRMAASLLLGLIKGTDTSKSRVVLIEPKLIARKSSLGPRQGKGSESRK